MVAATAAAPAPDAPADMISSHDDHAGHKPQDDHTHGDHTHHPGHDHVNGHDHPETMSTAAPSALQQSPLSVQEEMNSVVIRDAVRDEGLSNRSIIKLMTHLIRRE